MKRTTCFGKKVLPLSTLLLIAILMMLNLNIIAQPVIRLEPSRDSGGNPGAYQEYFSKYAIGSLDKAQVATLLQANDHFDTLTIVANGISYSFSLEAKDVRADNYVLRAQTESGIQALPRSPNKTFSGLTWGGNRPVCITADEHFFTAMITTNEGPLFIESAKLIDPKAGEDQFVIYHESDVVKRAENSLCGAKIAPHQQGQKKDSTSNRALITCTVAEIAIANDYLMFAKYGNNVSNVEVQNLAVLNLVNTNYDNEFAQEIWHKAVEIFVVTTFNNSPWYTGTDYIQLLNSFTAWAPTGFTSTHDEGSLWTNRDLDGSVIGLAWTYRLCQDSMYNILQDFSPIMGRLRVLQAHELGHNYGYGHDAGDGFIMSPSVSETTLWSSPSISSINTELIIHGSCLANCPPASTGRVGIGTTSPNTTSILDITSTNKGLLMPRMTSVQRNAIYKPADGLVVYDTGTKSFWFYNNSAWVEIIDGTAIQPQATNITLGNPGNVGIGLTGPMNKLDIATTDRQNVDLHPTNLPLYITGSSPSWKGLEIRTSFADYGVGLDVNGLYATGWAANSNLSLSAKGPAGYLNFNTNAIERMRITGNGNVGIGTTTPNASALIDLTSNSKGILIPRMTTVERTSIASPATGLLVFDTTTNSFWFRGVSAWVELSDNLDTEVFRNGPDKIYMGLTDSVGIGTMNPAYKLDVKTGNGQYGLAQTDGTIQLATWLGDGGEIGTVTNHVFRLFANNGQNQFELQPSGNIGIGVPGPQNKFDIANGSTRTGTHATGRPMYITGNLLDAANGVEIRDFDGTQGIGIGRNTVYAAGSSADQNLGLAAKGAAGNLLFTTNGTEKVRITPTGQIGVGVTAPHASLHLASIVANRRLILWETANNDQQFYGLGINGSVMRYQVDATASDHVFYAGINTTTSKELMRIKGTGAVGIGVNNPDNLFSVLNKFGVDANGAMHVKSTPRMLYFMEDGVANRMLLSHSPSFPAWGLQYLGTNNEFRFLADSSIVMSVNLGANQVEVNKLGIGTFTPHAQLQLATSVANRKLVLYEVADNDHQYHGFGINNDGSLRYQTANTANDHVFYAATSATNSNELARIKGNGNLAIAGVVEVESVIAPTFQNSFTNYNNGYTTVGYFKDKMGMVHLKGMVTHTGDPDGLVVFTLPIGYRPGSGERVFMAYNSDTVSRVDILANGNVVVSAGVTGWLSLDGIYFRAD